MARAPGVQAFFRKRSSIAYYHGVFEEGDPRRRIFGGKTPAELRAEMGLLARVFEIVDLPRLLSSNEDGVASRRPLLAITFDDGLDLVRSGTADLLADLRIPATMFVPTLAIGCRHLLWQHKLSALASRDGPRFVREFNRLTEKTHAGPMLIRPDRRFAAIRRWPARRKEEWADHLWRACDMPPVDELLDEHRPYVDWSDLEAWRAKGHGVGSHSRSHPFCGALDEPEVEEEIVSAAEELQRRLGLEAIAFAYPFGDRLPPDREAALARRGVFSCMLGAEGLSPRGTPPHRLERANADAGLDRQMFGRPVLKALSGAA